MVRLVSLSSCFSSSFLIVCSMLLLVAKQQTSSTYTVMVQAWTSSSSSSSFAGRRSFVSSTPPNTKTYGIVQIQNGSTLEMKKGKANVPPQMRGQYKKMQEMQEMRKQMIAASQPGTDGLPVFNLFVRTKRANLWYPCGSFKGDERSAALAKSYADGGMLAGISKKQLDGGVSGSLYRDLTKLKETVCRAYPQLRKAKDELQFGYKLAFEGLAEDKAKEIIPIEPKEQKGVFDGIKNLFS